MPVELCPLAAHEAAAGHFPTCCAQTRKTLCLLELGVCSVTPRLRLPAASPLGLRLRAASAFLDSERLGSTAGSSKSSRPLLFQDVDGVLNRYVPGSPQLEGALLRNLKGVLERTDADLVISSSWRTSRELMTRLRSALEAAGISGERIAGETPILCGYPHCRAQEIGAFLDAHPRLAARRWVAVDDVNIEEQDLSLMKGHFVKTDSRAGLTPAAAETLAAALLRSPDGGGGGEASDDAAVLETAER
eukprot:TRINITY_DN28283_c0_g1_i1.p1 TRINITY_DN28283_c0_g1~~TRINITY_DN28283_c0_g1_i1.p1  ORF type:complete len:247 (-),score=57.34 TRINITY_DN28283_c0_g1_i1:40-780(-)